MFQYKSSSIRNQEFCLSDDQCDFMAKNAVKKPEQS